MENKEDKENADPFTGPVVLPADVFLKLVKMGPLTPPSLAMPLDPDFVQDFATDFHGKPASKSTTGNWKACLLIFGKTKRNCMAWQGELISLGNYECACTTPL